MHIAYKPEFLYEWQQHILSKNYPEPVPNESPDCTFNHRTVKRIAGKPPISA
jgi:hypothetical protein